MATSQLDAWLSTELTNPADSAEGVFVNTFENGVWVLDSTLSSSFSCLFCTVCIQAWKTVLLTAESSAWMSTSKHLVAVVLDKLSALFSVAHILEGCTLYWLFLFDLLIWVNNASTETALLRVLVSLQLLASHPNVVWLLLAVTAEVLLAEGASYSELGHVLTCLWSDELALVVLHTIVNLTHVYLHHSTTWAIDNLHV